MKRIISLVVCVLILSGCATTGPKVSNLEIEKATEELKVKALAYQLENLERVNSIGYHIILNLPQEDRKDSHPFIGIIYQPIDKYLMKVYNLTQKRGVVIIAAINGFPAKEVGLMKGDILISINSIKIKSVNHISSILRKTKPGENINIEVLRGNQTIPLSVKMGEIPLQISINMVDEQDVNAAASPEGIFVTYGLIRFAKDNDEIAAVLGHELAHITKGHTAKKMGIGMLTGLAGLALGIVAEANSPGSGDAIFRGSMQLGDVFNSTYSRELEKEADYFGIKYVYLAGYNIDVCAKVWERFAIEIPQSMVRNFLNTHPSSPERMVRMQKTIEELKGVTSQNVSTQNSSTLQN